MKRFELIFRTVMYILAIIAIAAYLTGCVDNVPTTPPATALAPTQCPTAADIDTQSRAYAEKKGWTLRHVVLKDNEARAFLVVFNRIEPPTNLHAQEVHLFRVGRANDLVTGTSNGCVVWHVWMPAKKLDALLESLQGVAI